jgi:hypothetical protein
MEFKDLDLAGVVERVLVGRVLERRQPRAILRCPDERLPGPPRGDSELSFRKACHGRFDISSVR